MGRPHRHQASATSVSDIVIRNFTLEGNNPRTGDGIYDPSQENQHGVGVYGGTRIEIANNTIRKTWADGVYANNDSTSDWVNGLWVHDNTFTYIGRNAFTMNGVQERAPRAEHHRPGRRSVLDIEPDLTHQGVVNVTLRNNRVGAWGLSNYDTMHFVACANHQRRWASTVSDLTITGNLVTGWSSLGSRQSPNAGGLSTWIGKSNRQSNVTFTNNTTTRAGAGPVLIFEHVDGLTVTGNTQPLTSGSLLTIYDTTNVTRQ